MTVIGISYRDSGIRFSKYGALYLRLRPGRWIRIGQVSLVKLRREAYEKGYRFDCFRMPPQNPMRCRRCGKKESKDRRWSSVYGFCNKCHDRFMPYLRKAQEDFIRSHRIRKRR
jgi:hypothetical protein